MAASAKIEVDFIAQTAAFNANITKAAANLNSNAAKMNRSLEAITNGFKSLATAGVVAGLIAVGERIAEAASRSLEYAGSLQESAQQLGVNSAQLQIYRQIAAQAGIEQESLDKGLAKLTRSLGDASVGAKAPMDAFKALGISIRDSNGNIKTAGDVIPEITKKFDSITSPAQRATVEVALFGKAGQQLDTLLGGGSAEVGALKKHLEELGVVLSEDEIRNADKAADKIGEVKWVLEQSFAKSLSDNITQIYEFANSLEKLISVIPRALRWMEELGQKFNIAKAIKDRGYYPMVDIKENESFLRENQRGLARNQLLDKLDALPSAARTKAIAAMKPSTRAYFGLSDPNTIPGPPRGTELPNFKASPSPKTPAKPELEEYQQQLAQLNTQLLQATRANLTSVDAQYKSDLLIAKSEEDQVEANLRKKAVTNKIVKAHLGELLGIAAQVEAQKEITLKNQMLDQQSKNAVEILTAANDNARDLLQSQEQVTRTAADRRDIELKLLELDTINQRLKLQQIIDSTTASDQEKKLANQNLAALGDLVEARRAAVLKATEGPLGQFVNSLPQNQGDVLERQQQIIVDAANRLMARTQEFADSFASSINSGVQDLLQGKSVMESLKDVVAGLAQTFQKAFILDPLEEFVRNKVSGPLAQKLFGAPAGQNGLSQSETNQALAAAGNVSKLTMFGTAVDAATLALQRLHTGSVMMEGLGAGALPIGDASANYNGVIMDNPFASASDGLSALSTSAVQATDALNAQVPALAQFGSSLLSLLGGNVSGGGGFLQGLLGIAGMFAGSVGGGLGGVNGSGVIMENPFTSQMGFADGGRPPLGVPSWVGERGRELFVPDVPGTIIPHGASMRLSRMAANNNDRSGVYNIHVAGPMSEREARRTGAQIATAMRQEQARSAKQGF